MSELWAIRGLEVYPCNRGGGLPKGSHYFQVSGSGVCCIFCGARPATNITVTYGGDTKDAK